MNEVRIRFGALAPTIAEQVPALSKKDARMYQAHADAITRLCLHGLLSDGDVRRARSRMMRLLARALTPTPSGSAAISNAPEGTER